LESASVPVPEGEFKKGRGASGEYVCPHKWEQSTEDDMHMVSEDIEYYMYQHALDWMQQSGMQMLPDHTAGPDEFYLWKLMGKTRPAEK
jgi:hypothetical protein